MKIRAEIMSLTVAPWELRGLQVTTNMSVAGTQREMLESTLEHETLHEGLVQLTYLQLILFEIATHLLRTDKMCSEGTFGLS